MSDSENSSVENGVPQKRCRKIIQKQKNRKREDIKTKRECGEGYVSSAGKQVSSKEHGLITDCCKIKCFENVSVDSQFELFNLFYNGQSKCLQDSMLSNCMESAGEPKTKTVNPKKSREHIWLYHISIGGTKTKVCRNFILKLFQVSLKRLRIVQKKILLNDSFEEKRGSHANRPKKITDDVVTHMREHLFSIPHDESHYCSSKSNLLYFDNTLLNVKDWFLLYNIP